MQDRITSVIFDLGNVLIEWDPRFYYQRFIPDKAQLDYFLKDVCSPAWIASLDRGLSLAQAANDLCRKFPEHESLIKSWNDGFDVMMKGPIVNSVHVLRELSQKRIPLYALTNWAKETFPLAQNRFDFLRLFQGIVVSGHEGVGKPDARIFEILFDRYGVDPGKTLFIDDNPMNIETAGKLGLKTILFTPTLDLHMQITTAGIDL